MAELPAALDQLCARLLTGEIGALARAISLVENPGAAGNALLRAIRPQAGTATLVGITGPPGAGKSTLINGLISALRATDKRVAVVAVDPSSPVTGGAVLGDRTRMGAHTDDPGVYIRSVSARGHLGGLSAGILRVVDLIDAAGWDLILLETVGAGQSETEVAEVADLNVVVNAPGLGDEVQAIKAGILEIADILVVNKFDSPLAERTRSQLKAMLTLRAEEAQDVPVLATVASEGQGVAELLEAIQGLSAGRCRGREARRQERTRRLLAQEAAIQLKHRLLNDRGAEINVLIEALSNGGCDMQQALDCVLSAYSDGVKDAG